MKLVASKTSPYARKIRVLLAEKQIAFEFVEESAWNADTTVPRYNPLNKIPGPGDRRRYVPLRLDGDRGIPRPLGRSVVHPVLGHRARARAARRGAGQRDRRRGDRDLPRAQARRGPPGPGVDRPPAQQGGRGDRGARARAGRQGVPARRHPVARRRRLRVRPALAGVPPPGDRLARAVRGARPMDREARVAPFLREHAASPARRCLDRLRRSRPRQGTPRPDRAPPTGPGVTAHCGSRELEREFVRAVRRRSVQARVRLPIARLGAEAAAVAGGGDRRRSSSRPAARRREERSRGSSCPWTTTSVFVREVLARRRTRRRRRRPGGPPMPSPWRWPSV